MDRLAAIGRGDEGLASVVATNRRQRRAQIRPRETYAEGATAALWLARLVYGGTPTPFIICVGLGLRPSGCSFPTGANASLGT